VHLPWNKEKDLRLFGLSAGTRNRKSQIRVGNDSPWANLLIGTTKLRALGAGLDCSLVSLVLFDLQEENWCRSVPQTVCSQTTENRRSTVRNSRNADRYKARILNQHVNMILQVDSLVCLSTFKLFDSLFEARYAGTVLLNYLSHLLWAHNIWI
jgi:hypothetical protein